MFNEIKRAEIIRIFESEAAELFSRFVGIYPANSLPPWYYYITTASLLIPIIKEQPANPAQAQLVLNCDLRHKPQTHGQCRWATSNCA